MKTESRILVLEGKLVKNPWGDWSDVDIGWYVDNDRIDSELWDFENKKVRITIEEILPETEEE